jgi:hypothetical protein
MSLKDFKKLDFTDQDLSRLQENIKQFVSQLDYNFLSGNLLETKLNSQDPIVIGTSTTLVSHGLGRAFRGFVITDLQGDARVWRDTTVTQNLDKFIPLRASSTVTVKLWVF